ncbi:uncharacterized protein METZ01_LOCUS360487, partial [marine metagenome]
IEAWINPTIASQNGRIVARGNTGTPGSYQLNINTNGRLRISFYENELNSSNNVINANTWQHLVLTRTATTVKGYVNAEEVISFSNSSDLTSSQSLVLGYEPTSSSYYSGLIDEVAIWNDALTAAEITTLYNSGSGLSASSNSGDYTSSGNLQGYWNFNEGSGTTLTDLSGNGNNGTINGATWSTSTAATAGSYTYSPTADYNGSDSFVFSASDGALSDTATVSITVTTIDDLPVVANPLSDITVNEDAQDTVVADLDVVFMDVDEELEYSHVVEDTALVFASVTNDTVTLQFLPDANGSTNIIFTATNPTIR